MNAYELADKGLNSEGLKHLELWNLCIEMCRMLRQQADRIAELEKQSEPSYFGLTNDHTWLSCDEKMYNKLKPTHRMKCYTTPQTKPLSDEPSVKEITDLWLDVINNRPANDKRPIEWHFANALLAKVRGEK